MQGNSQITVITWSIWLQGITSKQWKWMEMENPRASSVGSTHRDCLNPFPIAARRNERAMTSLLHPCWKWTLPRVYSQWTFQHKPQPHLTPCAKLSSAFLVTIGYNQALHYHQRHPWKPELCLVPNQTHNTLFFSLHSFIYSSNQITTACAL